MNVIPILRRAIATRGGIVVTGTKRRRTKRVETNEEIGKRLQRDVPAHQRLPHEFTGRGTMPVLDEAREANELRRRRQFTWRGRSLLELNDHEVLVALCEAITTIDCIAEAAAADIEHEVVKINNPKGSL